MVLQPEYLAMLLLALLLSLSADASLATMGESDVSADLAELRARGVPFEQRVAAVARLGLGTPYADGPLGEGPGGTYDDDPLIDLGRVDCVTYVEQTVALSAAPDYETAFDTLQKIRYRGGNIDYATRNHFMIADWVENNPWCTDISKDLGVKTAALTRTISKRDFFQKVKAPDVGQDIPDRDVTIHYVPSEHAAAAEAQLPDAAIIVFVGKVDWLFALHCGLYVRDEKGQGQLLHASSKGEKVVAVGLADYLAQNAGRYLGFTAYRVLEID